MQNDTRTVGQKIADEYYDSIDLTKPRLARMIDTSLADLLERLKSEQMVEKVKIAIMIAELHDAPVTTIDKAKAALAAIIEELWG